MRELAGPWCPSEPRTKAGRPAFRALSCESTDFRGVWPREGETGAPGWARNADPDVPRAAYYAFAARRFAARSTRILSMQESQLLTLAGFPGRNWAPQIRHGLGQ